MRILVVEDARDMNRLIVKALSKAGYSFDGCFDGEEATEYLQGAEYDGVILDVMMPKMDGYELLQRLRDQGNTVPVLFLTARDAIELLHYDYDAEYYAPPANNQNPPSGTGEGSTITADAAKALALAQVPGATAADIREFSTDHDGRLEYEGKIYYEHMEYEFEIDGCSGAILSWEVESIFD